MPEGNPQVGEIWRYLPKPDTVTGHWEERIANDLKITTLTPPRVGIEFLEVKPLLPHKNSFSSSRFKDGGTFVYIAKDLHVYELAFGKKVKEEVAKVKKVSDWSLVEKVIPEFRLILLYGPPGTGKTTAGNRIGLRGGEVVDDKVENPGLLVSGTLRPIYNIFNITLTEETPAAELRGHYIMKGGEFEWQDGTGVKPFRSGGRLVLNEIDKASGDCLQFCHALLDDPDIAAITLPTGETVKPDPDFSVVATMNGVPEDLPEALRDRFAVKINIKKPHPLAIKSLPEDLRGIAKKTFTASGTERAISFRSWKAFGELRERLDEEMAARAVFGDRAENVLNTMRIEKAAAKTKSSLDEKMTYTVIDDDVDDSLGGLDLSDYDEDHPF